MIKIAPSILAADFLRLGDQVKAVETAGADRIHLDVMDGSFVPNISFGLPILQALRTATRLPLEAHLMIVHPELFVEPFAHAGADTIIVHQEGSTHLDRLIHQIKDIGKRAGVALNPSTPISSIEEVVELLDLVLLMTVNPGFGGQEFIDYSLMKTRRMRQILDSRNPQCDLEVDGGIDLKTAPLVVSAGARVLVSGTAIFRHAQGPQEGLRVLARAVDALAGKSATQMAVRD